MSKINDTLSGHPKTRTNPTWRDTIRRVVRQYKIFQAVPPERSGVYRLAETETPAQPASQDLGSEDTEINHGIAQGMLVALGRIYGYETFVPAHDQTARVFQERKLGELITVKDCTDLFHGPNLSKIREIDALWFDEDDYGLFPVYAFEVEHTTRVRDGLDRLLKIPRRFPVHLFVIGPGEEERNLFDRLINQTPFRSHSARCAFRLYSQLQAIYNSAVNHDKNRNDFGLVERYRRI